MHARVRKLRLRSSRMVKYWFKNRYILVRYEDIISNISKEVSDIYKYFDLPMVEVITN